MKKLNLKSIGEKLSKEQMKNVAGGSGCGGSCGLFGGPNYGCSGYLNSAGQPCRCLNPHYSGQSYCG